MGKRHISHSGGWRTSLWRCFYFYMGSMDGIQVTRLVWQAPSSTEPSWWPQTSTVYLWWWVWESLVVSVWSGLKEEEQPLGKWSVLCLAGEECKSTWGHYVHIICHKSFIECKSSPNLRIKHVSDHGGENHLLTFLSLIKSGKASQRKWHLRKTLKSDASYLELKENKNVGGTHGTTR